MWRWSIIILCLLLLSILTACTKTKNDTYLRFDVDGKQYQVGTVGFYCSKSMENRYLFMIAPDVRSNQKAPKGSIQWIMPSSGIEELRGKEIDLSIIAKEAKAGQYADPSVLFTLEKEDTIVSPPSTGASNLTVMISSMDNAYIEGSFSGSNFAYMSLTEADTISKSVDISGSFRAKIYNKDR